MRKPLLLLPALAAVFVVPHLFAVTVTTLNDDGPGSLRAAVVAGGNIDFAVTGTITLTSGELILNNSLTMTGPGANQLTIARSSEPGTPEFRLMNVHGNLVISGVTLSNGMIGTTDGYANGAGFLVDGGLTLVDCAVTGNRSIGGWTRGTGIYVTSSGQLSAINCLFADNRALGFDSEGSAIYNFGSLVLTNCTFSGNSAGYSAAIQNDGFSDGAVIESCTIFGNFGRFAAAIVNGGSLGSFAGKITVRNSIVAGNAAWDYQSDIESRGEITFAGFNLIGIFSDLGISTLQFSDRTNVVASDLYLAPLADNGGPTLTHALLTNSPALDAGPPVDFPATDQRGVARPQFARCDIGALEANSFPIPPANQPPVANSQTVTAHIGTPLPINFTGSDPEGAPVTFRIVTLPVWGTLSGTPPNVVYTPATDSPNWDLFAFAVNDGQVDSVGARVDITVLPPEPPTNHPPTVSIIAPANGSSFTAPANILMFLSVTDPDGLALAAHVEIFEGVHELGEAQPIDPGPPHTCAFQFFWTNVPPGEYDLKAKVTDEQGATAFSAPVHVSVWDRFPAVTIRATDTTASESGDPGAFTVSRTGPTNADLFVYCSIGGTASNGLDYVTLSHRVTIPAGAFNVVIPVIPIDDTLIEGSETVELSLAEPPPDPPLFPYIIGSPSNAVVTIHDDDGNNPPIVNFFNPPDGSTFTAPTNLHLVAYARDIEDGYDVKMEFFEGTNRLGAGIFVPSLCPDPFCPNFVLTWSNVPPGDYVLRARATDSGGAETFSEPAHIKVNGPATNTPPLVKIIYPPNGTVFATPTNIHLVAYAFDKEDFHGIVDYPVKVEFFEGTNSLWMAKFVPMTCPGIQCLTFSLTWSNVPLGDYVLTAKATDTAGASSLSDPVQIIVRGPETNRPPYVQLNYPHDGTTFIAPTNIELVAYAQDREDGYTVHVEFFADGNDLGTGTFVPSRCAPPYCPNFVLTWPNAPPGDHVLTARATDTAGAVSTSVPVHISVRERANLPPTVRITSPTNGTSFVGPIDIAITAEATDSDDAVGRVEFYANDNLIGTDAGTNKPSYSVIWSNAVSGLYALRAKAYDSRGGIGLSEPVRITITGTQPPTTNRPPVVRIFATDPIASEGTNFWRWYDGTPIILDRHSRTNTATFVVRRTSSNGSLTVNYTVSGTASNGVDYLMIADSVTIPAGERSARIIIRPIDDRIIEDTETVILKLLQPTDQPVPYSVGWPGKAAALIVDNDGGPPGNCRLCDGTFHLTLPATPGSSYRVEASFDMVHWVTLGTNTVSDINLHIADPEWHDFPNRFYRAVPEPEPIHPLSESTAYIQPS